MPPRCISSQICSWPRRQWSWKHASLQYLVSHRAQTDDDYAADVLEDYTRHRAHPYLRKIETAGGWKAYEKAHRTKLLATFVPKFTHLVPKELVPLIVEFSFHVGFY